MKAPAKAADLKLISLSPVNPEALARTIRPAATVTSTGLKRNVSPSSADSGVMEFRAVAQAPTHGTLRLASKSSKQSLLKNIHGEASGALDSGAAAAQAANAAVGANSKSGKTHIFVETDHNQNSVPR